MENSQGNNEHPPKQKYSRRRLLQGAAAVAAGAAVGGLIVHELSYRDEPDKSPERLTEAPEFLGFNTAVYAQLQGENDLSLQAYIEDVDSMAKEGQNIVRFSIRDWEIAPAGDTTKIHWNEENLKTYDAAINYAKENGLKVFLVVNTPDFAKTFSPEDYEKISKTYFSFLAERYQNNLQAIQIFNEPNIHSPRNYNAPPNAQDLEELQHLTKAISESIKTVNPDLQTTVNVGGWPLDEKLIQQWELFYDSIAPHIDFLSLDLYPDDNMDVINSLGNVVKRFKNKHQKDVMISEIGLPTAGSRFSEEDQEKYLSQAISVLQKAGVLGILPYQIRDSARYSGPEASFGIKRADGTPKESYVAIQESMKPKDFEADEPQNT